MSANFILTLTAPRNYGLEEFDGDASIWAATDNSKTSIYRYTNDPSRDSVMVIQSASWTLGDGKTLGDMMHLNDSIVGGGEGAYKDFSVTPGVRYSFHCLHRVGNGTLRIQLYDQTNDTIISSVDKTNASWNSHEISVTIPDECETLRVKFLQSESDVKSGPFYIDAVSLNGNVLLSDPDSYSRIPKRVGSLHQTLSGRRIYDLRSIHYSFYLGWNFFDETQYENFREIYYSNELLYFDDGDVPPLIESEEIYDTGNYDYESIEKPSSTHIAYSDSSSSLPSGKSDFETTEFLTSEYQAISSDDEDYKETSNPGADKYLYHKFLLLSSIGNSDIRRFTVKLEMSCDDSSTQNLSGGVLYAWNGTNWVELARNTSSAKSTLSYSTTEAEIASQFVDNDDNYIRLLLRSRNRQNGSNDLSLRTYYVECKTNEGLDSTVNLSHKAILDEDGDVYRVKNLTRGMQLQRPIEYTISNDRRAVIMGDAYANIDGEDQYFSAGDVLDAGENDFSISMWIKRDSNPPTWESLVYKYSTIGYTVEIDNDGRLRCYIQDSDNYAISSSDGLSVCDGKWHHIAVVFDRDGDMTRYVDGSPYGTANDISSVNQSLNNGNNFTIGARSSGSGSFLTGCICDLRIWIGGVWSEAEILAQAYNPLDISVGGANTSSWYFSDSATSTSVKDTTDSNDLALYGGDTTNYGTHSRTTPSSTGDKIEVKYNRYFEVMFDSIPEEWFRGDPASSDITRSAEIVLETLSESK